MPEATDFQLVSVLAVIFTPNTDTFSQPRALSTILKIHQDRYDGEILTLPLPAEAPPELPRIILQSKDNRWKLQIGPSRLESIWNAGTLEHRDPDAIRQCTEMLTRYVRRTKVAVSRGGVVLNRFYATQDGAQQLVDLFTSERAKNGPFRRPENFEIHNHKRYQLQATDMLINSWVRCKTNTLLPLGIPGIVVEQDLNTLEDSQESMRFSLAQLQTFFRRAETEAHQILGLYFPPRA